MSHLFELNSLMSRIFPKKLPSILLLVFASFLFTGCVNSSSGWKPKSVNSYVKQAPNAKYQPASSYRPYTVGQGDRLQVRVFGEPTLTGEYAVDGSGVISMPLLRSVSVAGLTTRQVERTIASRLRQKFLRNPNVSVEIRTFRPFFILGEVTRSGQYPYVDGMDVQTAVAIAGGYTARARRSKVKVTRKYSNGTSRTLILRKTAVLMPGDTILVEERFF